MSPAKDPTRREFLRTAGLAGAFALGGFGCDGRDDPGAADAVPTGPAPGAPLEVEQPVGDLAVSEALFRVRHDGVTLHWLANRPHEARLLAGPDSDSLREITTLAAEQMNRYDVRGQDPGASFILQTQYRSTPNADWRIGRTRRVQTTRPAGETFKMVVMADTHINATMSRPAAAEAARRTAAAVIADEPDFVVFIGDEASLIRDIYRGRRVSETDAILSWTRWRDLYADLLARVPSCLVLGNHEGEAGYYQTYKPAGHPPLYLQRLATITRKRLLLNPDHETYPEGGENEGWQGDPLSPATGGAELGNRSPLENYFAWTWGDALFVVIDVHRYTNPGGSTPSTPEQWTLGEAQMRWFEQTLRGSDAKWKIVLGHHLVGGWPYDGSGKTKQTDYAYGRGGGRYARVGEQARVNDLMKETGARFFLYGHDHVFAHQPADEIEFVCCGRPSYLNPDWFGRRGFVEAYGSAKEQDFIAAVGYTRLTISPDKVDLDYVRAAEDPGQGENIDTPVGEVAYRRSFEV